MLSSAAIRVPPRPAATSAHLSLASTFVLSSAATRVPPRPGATSAHLCRKLQIQSLRSCASSPVKEAGLLEHTVYEGGAAYQHGVIVYVHAPGPMAYDGGSLQTEHTFRFARLTRRAS